MRPLDQLQNWGRLQLHDDAKEDFVLTQEDADALHEFISAFCPETNDPMYDAFLFFMTSFVMRNIDRYGDTGFGDKPDAMNRFAYWASHLSNAKLDATLATLRERPPSRRIVTMCKKSAKSKCGICKQPFHPGKLSLCERDISTSHPFEPTFAWRVKSTRHYCVQCVRANPERFRSDRSNGSVCVVDTAEADRERASELAEWLNVKVGVKRPREEGE